MENRILGQPALLQDGMYEDADDKAKERALNKVNMPQNSQFALAIIQTLLDNTAVTAFESIE